MVTVALLAQPRTPPSASLSVTPKVLPLPAPLLATEMVMVLAAESPADHDKAPEAAVYSVPADAVPLLVA